MNRAGIALVSLASLAAATFVTGVAITRAEATDGAQPNTSCATTAACVEGDNTSTGPGVKGTSTKGHGVVGTTKSKGTTQGSSHAGVLGQDLQTGGGTGNTGVEGTSTFGNGVEGSSVHEAGVSGVSADSNGVLGQGGFGVQGSGTAIGIVGLGESPATQAIEGFGGVTDTIFANGIGGNLFRGNNNQSVDVFVVADSGDVTIGNSVFAGGTVNGLEGEFGSQGTGNPGVIGESAAEGIMGENTTTGDALFANGFGGNLIRANNSHGGDVFLVDDSGNVFANTFTSGFAQTTLQRTSTAQTVKTYASQAAQPTLEDTGEAQLVNGIARVALDAAYAATIDRSNYIVMVTPEGMIRGTLCVVQRTPQGFVVQENMGGTSSAPFAYRIVGKPYASTSPRLPLATMPYGFSHAVRKQLVVPRKPVLAHHAKVVPHLP